MTVRPVNDEHFLATIETNIANLNEEFEHPAVTNEMCKERFAEVKNQVLESVKARWIHPSGRRLSIASQLSIGSKRGRIPSDEENSHSRSTKPKVTSN